MGKGEFFEPFAEEAELAGLVGGNVENLRDAISGENCEVMTMYKEFAKAAFKDGDVEVASRFDEIRSDEKEHRTAYAAMLKKMQQTPPT